MFRFLNKIIRMRSLKKNLKSADGQVAIILILVIAAALIFYAVSLNLGQFTFSRALVTIASNTSASMLASQMASYGQALSSSSLEGKREICGWTGVLGAIISIIIIVVAIVVGIFTVGGGTAAVLGSASGLLALTGLVLATIALAIQVTIIQPGITEAWNEIISATLSMQNQFTEGAVQSALGKAVTDGVQVPDVIDSDRDRLWVPAAALGTLPYADKISRYATYYTERLRQIKDQVAYVDLTNFIFALKELLYDGTDGWGIHDPVPAASCFGRAECHPCCVPDSATIDGVPLTGLRSTSCVDPTNDVYWAEQCEPASPYQIGVPGDGSPGSGYPWLFDMYYENPYNAFLSFRELIGLDDEHKDFYKDSADPNSNPAPRASQFVHAPGEEGFRLEDATGFYSAPNPIQTDPLTGIYPFFYKMSDWGVDLANVAAHIAADPNSRECHWCDVRDPACIPCAGLPPHPHPGEIPQLSLPLDPAVPAEGLIYNLSYFVDEVGNPWDIANPFFPPLAVDNVTFDVPGNIVAEDPVTPICAQTTLYPMPLPGPPFDGFWRRGGDRFCRPTAPYFMDCDKCNLTSDCECGVGTDPADFPDDVIDSILYSLADFIEWAQRTIASAADLKSFSADFPNWYPEAAMWIEPESPPATQATDPPCFLCSLALPDGTPIPEGILWIWLKEITEMRDRIQGWINNYNPVTGLDDGYSGTTCTEAWCVPDAVLACPEVPAGEGESVTFNTNVNGVQGDIEDVVGCLNYNINGYDHVAGEAFKACLNNCGAANCTVGAGGTLPAFHLDGITPYNYPATALDCVSAPGWVAGNDWFDTITGNVALAVNPPGIMQGNDFRFQNCASSCSLEACHRLPRSMVPFSSGPIYWPNEDPGDPGNTDRGYHPVNPATADGDWEDLTAFSDCLNNCNAENCRVGPRLPTVRTWGGGAWPAAYPGAAATAADCAAWGPGNSWYDAIVINKNSITPAGEADMALMRRCFDDCNANLLDCQNMPGAAPYLWTFLPPLFVAGDCDPVTNQPLAPWDADIIANIQIAGGLSCDLSVGDWIDSTRQSAIEATQQMAKFTKRRDFLRERLTEAQNILNIFGEDTNGDGITDTGIIEKLETFLYGPAADLIRARIAYAPVSGEKGLPYQAIYGWRDESEVLLGGVSRRGKWHIVKVEARIPGMCDNRCSESQESPDPEWPRIITYTKDSDTKRCYKLINTDGAVKFRTTRWDEDRSTKSCAGLSPCPAECTDCGNNTVATYKSVMRFPNGAPIWRFKGNHPLRPLSSTDNPDELDGVCVSSTLSDPPGAPAGANIYEGAFIMNKYYPLGDPDENFWCWNLAHRLLSAGVVNETCARYYWHSGSNEGMGLEFVPCEEF